MNTPSRSTVGIGSSTRQPRLARYSALVAATGASTLAHAAIVSSGAGVVVTVNTTTAQQGFTSGPGGTTWHRTTNTQVFAVNGRNFSIQAFNQRTVGVPRLMGGAFGGTVNVGVGGPAGTPIEINKLASGAVVGGGATAFYRRIILRRPAAARNAIRQGPLRHGLQSTGWPATRREWSAWRLP